MKTASVVAALVAAAAAAAVPETTVSYDGYQVFRVGVGQEVARVNSIINKMSLTTWKGAPRAGAAADIVVPPSQVEAFKSAIVGLDVVTMHADLGASIAEESSFSVYDVGSANETWFKSYHPYAQHLQFLRDVVASYPSNSRIVTSGSSLNGNPITGLHIFGSGGGGNKPAVVLHGTVHAREWITTMVVEYLGYTLLSSYDSSPEVQAIVDKYDFYIFPVVNPDGFLYSQNGNRMWRKNRQSTPGSSCLGHDINRNWPFKWSVSGGASDEPCDEDFRGRSEADTPEAQSLSSFLLATKRAQGLKLFIDYHSYSQLFMTPYGYSCTAVASKNAELQSLARGAVAAIKAVHGLVYRSGPICTTIYQATGSSVDYVNDVAGADYTFTSELRDKGNYGFILPAAQIVPTAEETFAGLQYLLQNMQ